MHVTSHVSLRPPSINPCDRQAVFSYLFHHAPLTDDTELYLLGTQGLLDYIYHLADTENLTHYYSSDLEDYLFDTLISDALVRKVPEIKRLGAHGGIRHLPQCFKQLSLVFGMELDPVRPIIKKHINKVIEFTEDSRHYDERANDKWEVGPPPRPCGFKTYRVKSGRHSPRTKRNLGIHLQFCKQCNKQKNTNVK